MVNDKYIRNKKHVYFAIRKTFSEIVHMGSDNRQPIITWDQPITVITENKYDAKNEEDIIKYYTRKTNF